MFLLVRLGKEHGLTSPSETGVALKIQHACGLTNEQRLLVQILRRVIKAQI